MQSNMKSLDFDTMLEKHYMKESVDIANLSIANIEYIKSGHIWSPERRNTIQQYGYIGKYTIGTYQKLNLAEFGALFKQEIVDGSFNIDRCAAMFKLCATQLGTLNTVEDYITKSIKEQADDAAHVFQEILVPNIRSQLEDICRRVLTINVLQQFLADCNAIKVEARNLPDEFRQKHSQMKAERATFSSENSNSEAELMLASFKSKVGKINAAGKKGFYAINNLKLHELQPTHSSRLQSDNNSIDYIMIED